MITSIKLGNAVKIGQDESWFFSSAKHEIELDGMVVRIRDQKGNVTCTSLFNTVYWVEDVAGRVPEASDGRIKKARKGE